MRETFITAVEEGLLAVVKICIENGMDINTIYPPKRNPGESRTALTEAAYRGHIEIVQFLIDSGADIHFHCENTSVLNQAARGGHLNIVKLLVDAGVKLDTCDSTPLIRAICGGSCSMELAQYLIDAGDRLDVGDFYSPLICAVHRGRLDLVTLLVDAGADINYKPKWSDRTTMQWAMDSSLDDRLPIIEYLQNKITV